MAMQRVLNPEVYQVDRPLHHQLALKAYQESFEARGLSTRYEQTEMRRLQDVFHFVKIADPNLPTVKRDVDTFDLTNPYQASRIVEACKRDLPSSARIKACFKAIKRYCEYLKECPTIHIAGQKSLYLPDLYGAIESPVNRYTLPSGSSKRQSTNGYLETSEIKIWLNFTFKQIDPSADKKELYRSMQFHLMNVIGLGTGMRLQEILGLQIEHFNFKDQSCLVVAGKGSRGSGHRKRNVPIDKFVEDSVKQFLLTFPRKKGEPLFQSFNGERLSKSTAGRWMNDAVKDIKRLNLPILIEPRFGWHALRRTFAREFLSKGGSFEDLKRITGWSWASTAESYLGDSKHKLPPSRPPLMPKRGTSND